jgi:hypothetical protein
VSRFVALRIGFVVAIVGLTSADIPATAQTETAPLRGTVTAAGQPLADGRVVLYVGDRSEATQLGEARTDSSGLFQLSYTPPKQGVLYVEVTTAASSKLTLRSVVGVAGDTNGVAPTPSAEVTVNELTTAATSFALAQFSEQNGISGPTPGLQNAAATSFSLANMVDGTAGAVVTNDDNGTKNDTLATLGTLANLVSLCAPSSPARCGELLQLSTPSGGETPANTAAALVNLARNPALAPRQLFQLARGIDTVAPALTSAPGAWTLVLLYTEPDLYASGRIAIDSTGNLWSSNNWLPGTQNPSEYVTVLSPVGEPTLGSPLTGNGMKAGAWGAAFDNDGNGWFGSFGGNAMVQYGPDGEPISPATGWTNGNLDHPQGNAVDQKGNVWIANNFGPESAPGEGNVVVYPGGDASEAITITGGGLNHPFAVQIDGYGRAWVSNAGPGGAKLVNTRAAIAIGKFAGSVTVIDTDFKPTSFSPIENSAFKWPLGIAVDSKNNAWVSNFFSSTVTEMQSDGTVAGDYKLPKGTTPWSLAIDGSDRVWVAGFADPAVWVMCGVNTAACPSGSATGAIVSPESGLRSKAFQHFTSVQIDQSGNVWLSNNWSQLVPPVGGTGIAEIVGAATPVCTPLQPLPVKPLASSDTPCAQQQAVAVPQTSDGDSSGVSLWVWAAVAIAVVLIAGIAWLVLRRRATAWP